MHGDAPGWGGTRLGGASDPNRPGNQHNQPKFKATARQPSALSVGISPPKPRDPAKHPPPPVSHCHLARPVQTLLAVRAAVLSRLGGGGVFWETRVTPGLMR